MEPANVKNNLGNYYSQPDSQAVCSKNQFCVCCKYQSPVKVQEMLPYLKEYPKKKSAKLLEEGFTFGFKLAYEGLRSQRDSQNLKSINNLKDKALEKINKEVNLGRIAGPFDSRPLRNLIISPIGLVPKSEPGKYRLIQHLSFPDGSSINDGINREMCKVQYTSFDVAVRLVVSAGKGALMAKADIESAFRLLPVHPDDFQLLGIQVDGKYFVDKALPMGASCSPAHFERFSTFIEWVTMQESGCSRMCHYMDDVFFVGEKDDSGPHSCGALLQTFRTVCNKFGVPLAEEKTVGPVSCLTFLGLQLDSESQTVSIPQSKIEAVKDKIESALGKETVSLRELQSLIGSLQFICRAVAPGRAFLRRLIDQTCGIRNAWFKISLSKGAKSDLNMWLVFLKGFNGISIIPDQMWHGEDDLQLYTDACKSIGFGGFFNGSWFQGKWPAHMAANRSIAWMEFFPIVIAIVLWGHKLRGKRIILRCDNQSVVGIINKQTSRCPTIMSLVRFFVLRCLKDNIAFTAKHVAGKNNVIADALSRFQMKRFQEAAISPDANATPVPAFVWTL